MAACSRWLRSVSDETTGRTTQPTILAPQPGCKTLFLHANPVVTLRSTTLYRLLMPPKARNLFQAFAKDHPRFDDRL